MKQDKLDGVRMWIHRHENDFRKLWKNLPAIFSFSVIAIILSFTSAIYSPLSYIYICLTITFFGWLYGELYAPERNRAFDNWFVFFCADPLRKLRKPAAWSGAILVITFWIILDKTTTNWFLWMYLLIFVPGLSILVILLLEWFSLTPETRQAKINYPPPPL